MTSTYVPPLALRGLLVICALAVVSLLYLPLPLPILPQLARQFGIDISRANAVIGMFGFAYAFGFLVFGPLSDRLGRRTVMIWGLGFLAVLTAGLFLANSPAFLLSGRLLQGLAAAAFPPVVIAFLAERGTPRQRTWGVAWLSTAFLCAGLLGQIYGGSVASRWGLNVAWLPLAVIYAITALALCFTPKEGAARPGRSILAGYRPLISLLRDIRLLRVYVPAVLLLMCFMAFYIGLDMHAGSALREQGFSPLSVRELALPAFLAPLAVAVVMPKVGAVRIVNTGLMVATAGLAIAALAGTAHLYVLLAAGVIFVAGVGISVPGLIARTASVADGSVRGLAVAFYTFVLFVGASLGPWLAQMTAGWSMQSACAVLALLLGMATVFSMKSWMPLEKDCKKFIRRNS